MEVEAEGGSLKKGREEDRLSKEQYDSAVSYESARGGRGGERFESVGGLDGGFQKWERTKENMEGIRRELEEMRKRKEDRKMERERLEKRIGELEMKWEKGLRVAEGKKWRRRRKG